MAEETKTTQNEETISIADIDDNAVWTEHHENILVEWADKATCYRWLHAKSHIDYSEPIMVYNTCYCYEYTNRNSKFRPGPIS